MQESGFFGPRRAAAALLCIVLLMMAQQQASAAPQARRAQWDGVAPRRVARMTPLWRIMNSKPLGAYCQNNYECSTGLCRAGHCSTTHRSASGPVNY
ncbi:liver-expressed antimicrobial peptide 2 [Pungitius pungitius]|uniref:liver-expressed antimicrobial peptide 2 n=1 Tax=Pungitius pungitius TaxID=134920 RepID=UPI002E1207EB